MEGRHFVITGGAAGIGAETCTLLQENKVRLTVLDRHQPADSSMKFIQVDLNDMASIDQAVAAINEPVHGLLNVAGLPPRAGLAEAVLRVNFFGLRHLTLGLLPVMESGASIVNISSRAGAAWRENLDQVKALIALQDDGNIAEFCAAHNVDDTRAYMLSKEAVTVWTMAQTEKFIARDIRMNAVCPGAVETSILGDFKVAFGDRVDKMLARVGRPASAQEVARLAVFLAGPDSAWLKGVNIDIDGGIGAVAITDLLDLPKD